MLSSLPFLCPASPFFSNSKKKLSLVIHKTSTFNFVERTRTRASPISSTTEVIINNSKTVSNFNHLFIALIAAQEFELASKLHFFCLSPSPDNSTYSTLIASYCDQNESNQAFIILNHALQKGFELNVATFTTLINSFCKNGKTEKAFEVFDIMQRTGCEPTINTYNCLLKGLCYTGKVEEAYKLLKNIIKKPDIYSYTAVMDGLCKVSRSNEALELLFEAIETGLTPNVVTYNTLFNGYFKEGTPLKGIHLLKHMKDRNCMPDYITYNTLLHGLLKFGEIKESLKIYNEMIDVDERMENTLLRRLCRRSRKEKEWLKDVYQVFERMRSSGCVIYSDTYDLVIEGFCRGRESEKAVLSLYEMVRLMGYSPKAITFEYVIKTLCVKGKVDEAILVLFLCEEPSYISFDLLINELNRQRLLSKACVLYGLAMKRGVLTRRKPCS